MSSEERERSHPLQDIFSALPSWRIARKLHALYCRRILAHCGPDLKLSKDVLFEFPDRLSIGGHVFFNRGVIVTARAPITIGNDVLVGPYAIINSGNHGYNRMDTPIRFQEHRCEPISIEDDVWIGAHAVILKGVTIRKGSVIAAGAVVTHDVPEMTVVAGVPARSILQRGGER